MTDDALRLAREVDAMSYGPDADTKTLARAYIGLFAQYADLVIRADARSKMIEEYRETLDRMHPDYVGLLDQHGLLRRALTTIQEQAGVGDPKEFERMAHVVATDALNGKGERA